MIEQENVNLAILKLEPIIDCLEETVLNAHIQDVHLIIRILATVKVVLMAIDIQTINAFLV